MRQFTRVSLLHEEIEIAIERDDDDDCSGDNHHDDDGDGDGDGDNHDQKCGIKIICLSSDQKWRINFHL